MKSKFLSLLPLLLCSFFLDASFGADIYISQAGLRFEVTLVDIDITPTQYSLMKDNFLILRLFVSGSKQKHQYILETTEGRISPYKPSKPNQTIYDSLQKAEIEFRKIYKEKTNCDFDGSICLRNRGYYGHLDIIYEKRILVDNSTPSKLQSYQVDLMNLLNYKNKAEIIESINIDCLTPDTIIEPLGRITLAQMKKGMDILMELKALLGTDNKDKIIAKMTDYFMSSNPSGWQPAPISEDQLEDYIDAMETLMHKEARCEFFTKAENNGKNVLDVAFAFISIHAKITALEEGTKMYKFIKNYAENTQMPRGEFTIEKIFVIERPEETERFKPHNSDNNIKLLLHGTDTDNIESILRNGIKAGRSDQNGKAVYFTDALSLAARYSSKLPNKSKIVLAYKVALGRSHFRSEPENIPLDPYYDSVATDCQYVSRNTKVGNVLIPTGLQSNNPSAMKQFKEYVAFKPDRIALQYLIQIKPKPSTGPTSMVL